ncbi:uncharacterized protein LOC132938894 [Metopolophium dirhodum]|uniref:uncharacterized protein LOC132938894 n=1 Tax=Metopolophium dirhodum TaxID=44670 RepID=UPI00298F44DE|nr:uncharacterized protein LOC132938894 [Metopolophium dirhodum]
MRRRKLFADGVVRSKPKTKSSAPDKDYGLAEPSDDPFSLSPEAFAEKKTAFLKNLDDVDIDEVELQMTRGQSQCDAWRNEGRKRLTASKFGEICKMRENTSCKIKVHNILYKYPTMCKSMSYGIEMEPHARRQFEELKGLDVRTCGLFIDREFPHLAASPDGLIDDDEILEIKCPFVAKDTKSAIEAVENKLLSYCTINEQGNILLKKDHIYFYQVMGQLRVTKRNVCYFVIHTPNWTNVEKIYFYLSFWQNKMVDKLKLFYIECLLPEIIDPLYGKRISISDIRKPKHILNAKKKKLTHQRYDDKDSNIRQ